MVSKEEGLSLRELRESRGLTLNDVFQATKITVANLEAIESENYQSLPPPVYTHAYIKAYAQLLNAEEIQFVRPYEEYLANIVKTDEDESEEAELKSSSHTKKIIMTLFFFAALCILGLFIYGQTNFRAADIFLDCPFVGKTQIGTETKVKESVSPVLSGKNAQPITEDGAEGKKAQTETERQAGVKAPVGALRSEETKNAASISIKQTLSNPDLLIIEAQEETWLRITEDNNKSYQILMKPGERIERSAPNFNIDVGNAGGITLEFQGNRMGNLGKSGEVVHLSLPR